MLRIEMVVGSTTYRFASEDLDYGGYHWDARIINPFDIQRAFNWTDKIGNRRRQVSIVLDNNDLFFNTIHENNSLLNKKFSLYFDDASNLTKKLVGKCIEISDFNLTISLNINEIFSTYLDQPVPDAQLAYDYYSPTGTNDNWNAVPIPIGIVKRLKVAWQNKVAQRFLIGSGEIFRVDKVYFGSYVMYDYATGTNGYQSTPESGKTKVRVYLGKHGEVPDGIPSALPHFAYLEFYDETSGDPVEPKLADGTIPEVYVDIQGVVNESSTAAERNPARILYQLFVNPMNATTSPKGWGLEVDKAQLNFTEAIGYCETNGIVIDGVIDQKKNAAEWVDELLLCFGGYLHENNGFFHIAVDKAIPVVSCAFDEAGETGYDIILEGWKEPPIDQQINRIRLYYDKNLESGKYDKRPDFNEESICQTAELRDEPHYLKIGQWNTATLEFDFIKDDIVAHKLAQLYFKRAIKQLKTVSFSTSVEIPTSVDMGQKITISSHRFGWTDKEFVIEEIVKNDRETKISCREYDAAVYTFVNDLVINTYERTYTSTADIPGKPTSLAVAAIVTPSNDGTLKTTLTLSAVKAPGSLKVLFYRKKTSESAWQFFTSSETGYRQYLWEREDGNYYIRAVSVSMSGTCSDIAIVAGDSHYYGHPGVESALAISTVNATVGGASQPTVGVYFKTVRIVCVNDQTNKDLVGFEIWRAESPYSSWSNVGYQPIDNSMVSAVFLDESTDYGKSYKYKTKKINSSGTVGAFSAESAVVTTYQVNTSDIAPLSITNTQICNDSISSPKICANAICSNHLTTGEVLTASAQIRNAIIVNAHIASISADKITAGSITVGSYINASNYVAGSTGWSIHGNGSAEFSSVTVRGTVCASTGYIGGWTIGGSELYTGGAGMRPADYAFWAGASHADRASAPFRVYNNGNTVMTSLNISSTCDTTGTMIYLNNQRDEATVRTIFHVYSGAYAPALFQTSKNAALCATAYYRTVDAYAAASGAVYGYAVSECGVYGSSGGNCGVAGSAGGAYGGIFMSGNWPSIYGNNGIQINGSGQISGGLSVWGGISICTGSLIVYDGCVSTRLVETCCVYSYYYCYWSSCSLKECFTPTGDVLPRISNLPVQAFKYKNSNEWKIGTFAEDFQREFPYIGDGKGIPMMDGILLKGIQELNACIVDLKGRIIAIEEKLNS